MSFCFCMEDHNAEREHVASVPRGHEDSRLQKSRCSSITKVRVLSAFQAREAWSQRPRTPVGSSSSRK